MRIAVLGSWRESSNEVRREYWGLRDFAGFHDACHQLGRQLARGGKSVNVCDDSRDSAEFHVVQGFLSIVVDSAETSDDRPLVHIMSNTKTEHRPFEKFARAHDEWFVTEPTASRDIPEARLMAVRTADAVVLIAGTESTYESGLVSMISQKQMIPIGTFGGAADKVIGHIAQWRAFGLRVPGSLPGETEMAQLSGVWAPAKLKAVDRLLGHRTSTRLMIVCGRSTDWLSLKNHLHHRLHLPEPIVMREAFGTGRALADRFEHLAASVHGAIALVTPDDLGGPVLNEQGRAAEPAAPAIERARQNVWLEIGWFWGALGRRKILLLKRSQVEFPSDLDGIEYETFQHDPGGECSLAIENFVRSL